MRIDAHQHFWSYSPQEYPWIKPSWTIQRSFLPEDLEPLLKAAKIDGSVAVQARQCVDESTWLLKLADRSPFIRGVVGWVDLRAPDVEEHLHRFSQHAKFVGVRHVVQDEPDDQFMLGKEFQRGIGKLQQFGLAYDVLIFPRQLPAAIELVRAFPDQRFVVDHLAKPQIAMGEMSPWREQINELAKAPNLSCKISGLVTEAKWNAWHARDFEPFLDVIFQAFGPDRLMYGSDWPVALLSADYANVYQLAHEYVLRHAPDAEASIFGLNAARFYNL